MTHEHDHRHVHLDEKTLSNYAQDRLDRLGRSQDHSSLKYEDERQALGHNRSSQKMIPHDEKYMRSIEDKHEEEDPDTSRDS